jgi:hypothetical protein
VGEITCTRCGRVLPPGENRFEGTGAWTARPTTVVQVVYCEECFKSPPVSASDHIQGLLAPLGRLVQPKPAPAGWFPDPMQRYGQRYWDGQRWTEHVIGAEGQTVDPI